MDIDSGDDLWGAGEYETETDDNSANSESSNLTSLGYSVSSGTDMNRESAKTGTALPKSVLFKVVVTLLAFLVVLILLVILLG